jgi:sigma-B regulation protein RsbU (phosphoserine phosphatase)
MPSAYDETTVELKPGSTLILYSDGVTEATGPDNMEFGCCALTALASQEDLTPRKLIDEVHRFSHSSVLADDATVVIIQRLAA